MIVHCKTDRAIVLVPMDDGNGLWIFPSDESPWAGLHLDVVPMTPILPQIATMIQERLGFDMERSGYKVCLDFEDIVTLDDQTEVTVYVVQAQKLVPASSLTPGISGRPPRPLRLATLPEWLGRLPRTRQRLAWLRAWQIYQGVLAQNVKAVEASEVLKAVSQPGPQP
jgi:hypothetical protein